MNPIKAQRTWMSLSTKWIGATSFGRGRPFRRKNSRRKIKKGTLTNLIPVEVINALTGEVAKGYMRDISVRRLRKWLEYRNQRAQVEQAYLPPKSTLAKLFNTGGILDFPILIKLGKYQVPYLIDSSRLDVIIRNKQTVVFNLKTVDNLKYLEIVANKKEFVIKLFNKIKKAKKK